MKIAARPHSNGNTPETFKEIGWQLMEAMNTVDKALVRVRGDVLHGRNYQHFSTGALDQRQADVDKVMNLQLDLNRLKALAGDIYTIGCGKD